MRYSVLTLTANRFDKSRGKVKTVFNLIVVYLTESYTYLVVQVIACFTIKTALLLPTPRNVYFWYFESNPEPKWESQFSVYLANSFARTNESLRGMEDAGVCKKFRAH